MNVSEFISTKIRKGNNNSFSNVVVRVGIGSVALGVCILIVSYSVLLGFKNTITTKLFAFNSHIKVSKITLNRSFEETPLSINLKTSQILSKIPDFDSKFEVVNKAAILKTTENIAGILLKGTDVSYNNSKFVQNLVEGRWLSADSSVRSKEIVLSKKLAKKLKIKIGEELLIYFVQNPPRARKLKVVGLYETGIEEYDLVLNFCDLALLQKMNGWESSQIGHYEVFLKNYYSINTAHEYLLNSMANDLEAIRVTDMNPQFFEWFNLLDRNMLIVFVLIIVVAAFNMISVLIVMLMERTPMVALLTSLGMKNAEINQIFFRNGIKIIGIGLLWGNFLGIGIALVQQQFKLIPLDAESYYMNYVPIDFDWLMILVINLVTVILVGLALYLPLQITRRMNVIEGLKYKD